MAESVEKTRFERCGAPDPYIHQDLDDDGALEKRPLNGSGRVGPGVYIINAPGGTQGETLCTIDLPRSDGSSPSENLSYTAQNGVAVNDGTAYVVSDGRILKIDLSTGEQLASFAAPDGDTFGLAYGDGSLWFADGADRNFDGEIIELDPDTGAVRSRISTVYDPTGLAYGAGSLWVTDITANSIVEYTPTGGRENTFDVQAPTGSTSPAGLAHAADRLWLGTRDGGLYQFTPNGELEQEIAQRDTPYRGLGANDTALYGPGADGEVTLLHTVTDPTSGPNVSRVAFDYVDFGGNVNLEVNGERRNVEDFAALDGATVGGAAISVTPPTDTAPGTVVVDGTARSPITAFSVGGQELMIDGVAFGPSTEREATVEFSLLTPAASGYAVGDTFTSSPSGVEMTVEPFRFSDGETYRDGSGSRVASLSEPFSPLAGAGFLSGNTNLRFNISSVTASRGAIGDTVTIVGYDPENGTTERRTVRRTDEAFPFAAASLPSDRSTFPEVTADDTKRRIDGTGAYPWSAVGTVSGNRNPSRPGPTCSGAVIEGNHVLTAAHCVYNHTTGYWLSSRSRTVDWPPIFRPGDDADQAAFTPVNITYIQTYEPYVATGNATYDIAVLTLADEVAPRTGTFGYEAYPPGSSRYEDPVHLTGYPSTDASYVDAVNEQWDLIARGAGTGVDVDECTGSPRCHALDTGGPRVELTVTGQSGGPVWHRALGGTPTVLSVVSRKPALDLTRPKTAAVRISNDTYSDVGRMVEYGNDIALAPTARATANDTSAIGGRPVELDATNSTDPNGDPLAYEWTQVSGPDVTLSRADSATPEFAAPTVEGVRDLGFKLTVRDGTGRSNTARVTVRVAPAAGEDPDEPERESVSLPEGYDVVHLESAVDDDRFVGCGSVVGFSVQPNGTLPSFLITNPGNESDTVPAGYLLITPADPCVVDLPVDDTPTIGPTTLVGGFNGIHLTEPVEMERFDRCGPPYPSVYQDLDGDGMLGEDPDDEGLERRSLDGSGTIGPGVYIINASRTPTGEPICTVDLPGPNRSDDGGTSVEITDVTIEPAAVSDDGTTTHTLTIEATGVSDDGNADSFTVDLSESIASIPRGASGEVTVETADGTTIPLTGGGTSEDSFGFGISPDSGADTRTVTATIELTLSYPDVDANTTTAVAVRVADSSNGEATATAEIAVTAGDDEDGDGSEPGTTLRLVPGDETVTTSGTATYRVVVGTVTDGVGSYNVDVAVADPSTARITDASDETGGNFQRDLAADGSSVRLGTFAGDTVDRGTDVTIATVTVAGVAEGRTTLELAPTSVSDEHGADQYRVREVTGATVSVVQVDVDPPVVGESGSPARDPDDDGVYEDVNGDGDVTPGDATVLFDAVFAGDAAITDNPDLFDVNDDGSVTPGDATVLFEDAFG